MLLYLHPLYVDSHLFSFPSPFPFPPNSELTSFCRRIMELHPASLAIGSNGLYHQSNDLDPHSPDNSTSRSNPSPSMSMSHVTDQASGLKRKRRGSSRILNKEERKKVTRACDACKMWVLFCSTVFCISYFELRKLRCTGTQPCSRCDKQALLCEYNAEHRRGRPPSPGPPTLAQANDSFLSVSMPVGDNGLHRKSSRS
ncbi:uncharacterized protein LY89DRAFT_236798 [Mollisia scopiformis]|uniref:Zn(2)-C6 fungal-type domain-containing protein n=1 Tax=Mollisia scopiformis TaxID=149040 RepID=A0A194WT16_MOLSC|nr:uncharacterized protein LY89DRAFT_236798 [Mollisia scopiformis]KUJ11098.1 hypothetical protein LY89DRAFT_236798 [Mollisia scopiformis]